MARTNKKATKESTGNPNGVHGTHPAISRLDLRINEQPKDHDGLHYITPGSENGNK